MDDRSLLLQNQLCFPLYAAAKEVLSRYRPLLDDLSLTYTQYIVMLALWENKELSVSRLGERLHLDSGTLTPLLKRMAEKNLIQRERSRQDERQVFITLTPEGDALKMKALDIPAKISRCVNLDPEEAVMLYKLLYKVLEPNACDGRESL